MLDAVEAAGLACNPVCYPLNSFENRVYEVELADRSRIVAKFYRPGRWNEEQLLEEHRFLADLEAEEISVCPVRHFPDGTTLKRQDGIYYSLAERRGGRAPDELDDAAALRLGMLAGRMHNVGVRREAPNRLRLDPATYVHANLAWLEAHETVPVHSRKRYFAAARALADAAEPLFAGVAVHRIHGDLHLGNVLLRDGVLHLLDFDDMVTGPAVQDLWLALPGRDLDARRQRELFLEGYERFRLFDRSTLRMIEALRGLRLVHFATWLARRWHDPIFPATWPQFGEADFWGREADELERQTALVRRDAAGEAAAPVETDEELSNKDLFWDWEGD